MDFQKFLDFFVIASIITLVIFFFCNCLTGCSSFYKQRSGEHDVIGVQLPDSDISLELLSHTDGSSIKILDQALIWHNYKIATTNSYFYLVDANSFIEGQIFVCPTNSIRDLEYLFKTNLISK